MLLLTTSRVSAKVFQEGGQSSYTGPYGGALPTSEVPSSLFEVIVLLTWIQRLETACCIRNIYNETHTKFLAERPSVCLFSFFSHKCCSFSYSGDMKESLGLKEDALSHLAEEKSWLENQTCSC